VKPAFEVADIIGRFGNDYCQKYHPNGYVRKTLNALRHCRTAAMGYHEDVCTDCGYIRYSYNSCRNRHCPKCQNTNRERWIEQRREDLLPVTYFHVVFTLPHELNGLCLRYPNAMFDMLFASGWQTIKTLGYDFNLLGAEMGMVALLHSWGQTLVLHPHLHCIVPGGGIDYKNHWKKAKSKGKYLFPRDMIKDVYKGVFFKKLRRFLKKENIRLEYDAWKAISQKKWVVYAKPPFLGPEQVIEYLGRYSHKTAISNHRLLKVTDKKVIFSYKDYNRGLRPLQRNSMVRCFYNALPSISCQKGSLKSGISESYLPLPGPGCANFKKVWDWISKISVKRRTGNKFAASIFISIPTNALSVKQDV
jgi:hypothetical protein